MLKNLSEIIKNIPFLSHRGKQDNAISHLTCHSGQVDSNTLFFAHEGANTDSHQFIQQAIEKGAKVIVHTKELDSYNPEVSYIKVEDIKYTMSALSDAFYSHPSKNLKVIGVTGTDGKSTTTFYLYQLLNKLGFKTGYISTVAYDIGEGISDNSFHQSTPEAMEVHRLLSLMVENGLTYAVVESTSHGLSLLNQRLEHVKFSSALLTNITPEHLDFHKTLEKYIEDKARLFDMAEFSLINNDCPYASIFKDRKSQWKTYGLKDLSSDYIAKDVEDTNEGQEFRVLHNGNSWEAFLPVAGLFNVENALAAISLLNWAYQIPLEKMISLLPSLKQPEGRMDLIREGQPFTVLVDYAHTPASFAKIFPIFKERTKGKIITVFSHPGERDKKNRPLMGEVADKWSDIIFLTDENSRSESIDDIMEDIAQGIKGKKREESLFLVPKRDDAIDQAIAMAGAEDAVLILGKGHENFMQIGKEEYSWSDREEAIKSLKKKF